MAIPTTSMNLAAIISSLEQDEPISVNMKVYVHKSLAERINNKESTTVSITCDLGLQDQEWIPEIFIEE